MRCKKKLLDKQTKFDQHLFQQDLVAFEASAQKGYFRASNDWQKAEKAEVALNE